MKLTGRVSIRVNGELLRSKSGAKLNTGGVQRSTVKGDDGVHGYAETVMEPFIECSISHAADTDLEGLRDITDASITFETDTGVTWILRNAWLENPPELIGNDQGGDVSLRFVGISAERVGA